MIVGKRKIKDGSRFSYLFPAQKRSETTVKKRAQLSDTITLMKSKVRRQNWQTEKIAKHLKGATIGQTCRNIWQFAYSYFQYKPDKLGIEQVRSPARSFSDRVTGIDCDCFSVFIGSVLSNLNIPFLWRLAIYKSQDFEHVYPVAINGNQHIIMDAVIDRFNYEVPYTKKKDIVMDLHELNGIDPRSILDEIESETDFKRADLSTDALDLFGDQLEGLEGRAERKARQAKRKQKRDTRQTERKDKRAERKENGGTLKERLKERIKEGLPKLNRINPATVLLRAGTLAAMKLNLFKLASKLRFAYWTEAEARRNNMDLNKFNQLQRIREKVESIFTKAGGKPTKLKSAILTGKGNLNRMVQLNGLGAIVSMPSDYDDLETILGSELYEENFNDESINGLGAVGATAAISAATGVLAAISKVVKKLGGLFKRGSKQAQQEQIQDNTDEQEEKTRKFSVKNLFSKMRERRAQRKEEREQNKTGAAESEGDETDDLLPEEEFLPQTPEAVDEAITEYTDAQTDTGQPNASDTAASGASGAAQGAGATDEGEEGFFKKNWKWLVPVGVVGIGAIATGIYLARRKKSGKAVNGLDGLGAAKKPATKKKTTTKKKTARNPKTQPKTKTRKPVKRTKRTPKKVVELIA